MPTQTPQEGREERDVPAACVVALDVGGTTIKAGRFDRRMEPLARERVPTARERGPAAVVERLAETAERMRGDAERDGRRVAAAGVVVPGIVEEAQGVALFSANLGWERLPLRDLLAERLGLPVVLGHDVRAGGLAEGRRGAARGASDFLFLALGTGIAGAVTVGGQPCLRPYAGEIGHVEVEPDGRPCPCGGRGCLETVASGAAIAAAYTARAGTVAPVTAADVARRAASGEPAAAAVWQAAVDALARAVVTYTRILAPELVVVGGGLAGAGPALLGPLGGAVAGRLTFQPPPRIAPAELGDWAGCTGAGLLAWDEAGRRRDGAR